MSLDGCKIGWDALVEHPELDKLDNCKTPPLKSFKALLNSRMMSGLKSSSIEFRMCRDMFSSPVNLFLSDCIHNVLDLFV